MYLTLYDSFFLKAEKQVIMEKKDFEYIIKKLQQVKASKRGRKNITSPLVGFPLQSSNKMFNYILTNKGNLKQFASSKYATDLVQIHTFYSEYIK